MSFLGFFKKTTKENILDHTLKIFIYEDFKSYKTLNYDEHTTCEMILNSLKNYLGIGKNGDADNISLVIIIKEQSTGATIFKRVINHFENIQEVINTKPPKLGYIWYMDGGSSPVKPAIIDHSGDKKIANFGAKNSFGKLNF